MTALIVLIATLIALALALYRGRDFRVLDDERGWWPRTGGHLER